VRIADFLRRLVWSSVDRPAASREHETAEAVGREGIPTGFLDFRELADKYTFQQHAERSNAYFSRIDLNSPVVRKPFASPLEAVELATGVGAILSNLFLFQGAHVLDFGAGGCWLSRILALLGCQVTAADVSTNALRLGRELLENDPLSKHLQVAYVPLLDDRLPFADASFDRIVCFDALHHCPNQKSVVREFFRVLREGGIAAFHEPGPNHSIKSQSQQEMQNFEVVEGNIVMEDLSQQAKLAGFSKVELAVYAVNPAIVSLDDFNQFMNAPDGSGPGKELLMTAWRESENRRLFFLHKGDVLSRIDSRSPVGLLARFDVQAEFSASGVTVRGTVTNTGAASWLPSDQGPGSVNIGVHLYDDTAKLVDYDFARCTLSGQRTGQGHVVPVEFLVPFPESLDQYLLVVDLVAECITWFETGCSVPVRIRVNCAAGYCQMQ